MEAWHEEYPARMRAFVFPRWDALPDLGLYMDQVITYLQRLYHPLQGEDRRLITPSMINNYVKAGLVGRPTGKKYSREQIAQLVIICTLKQAISLEEMRLLIAAPGAECEALYRDFCAQQEASGQLLLDALPGLTPMQCAVYGAAYTRLCTEMLHIEGDNSVQ